MLAPRETAAIAPKPGATAHAYRARKRLHTGRLPGALAGSTAALWVAALSMAGFTIAVVWRPLGWTSDVYDVVALILLATGCLALARAAVLVNTARDWVRLAVHAVIIGFLIRSIPVLLLPFPPLQDGYFYLVSLFNLVDAHTFGPALQWWYSDVGRQLDWPILQLVTAQAHQWSGISYDALWRFIQPAMGSLTFVAIGLVAFEACHSWRTAAIAGLLGSFSDLVLYYQSEYQPQGTAILIFTFFIYLLLASRSTNRMGLRVLLLLVGAAFLFTHHASSLLLPLLLAPVVVLPYAARGWVRLGKWRAARERAPAAAGATGLAWELAALSRYGRLVLLLIVASLTIHVYVSSDILGIAIRSIYPPRLGGHTSTGAGAPTMWLIEVLRFGKYALLALAIGGAVAALRRGSPARLLIIILAAGLFLASTAAAAINPDGATRFLALWYPFGAVLAAAALGGWVGGAAWRRRAAAASIVVIVGAYAGFGILNAQAPAYVLDNTPRSGGAWYGNALPNTEDMMLAGRWLLQHTPRDARYAVDFSTRMAAFFFAQRPDTHVIDEDEPDMRAQYCTADFIVVDYKLDRGKLLTPGITMIDYTRYPRVYDNGSVAIYRRPAGATCVSAGHARVKSGE